MAREPTYTSWIQMRQRCRNPRATRYADYGGRGITITPRWETFAGFVADMGTRPAGTTLDRIDNDGHYEPGNCRWASPAEQNRNRRKKYRVDPSRSKLSVEQVGEVRRLRGGGLSAKVLAKRYGLSPSRIYQLAPASLLSADR